jgi:hypothetical protein
MSSSSHKALLYEPGTFDAIAANESIYDKLVCSLYLIKAHSHTIERDSYWYDHVMSSRYVGMQSRSTEFGDLISI